MIEAMKQALEALEELHRTGDTQVFDMCYAPKVIPALRQAIEQAEKQEPVAWVDVYDYTNLYYRKPAQVDVVPLYYGPATTQPQREWVGLTDKEMLECNMDGDFMIDRETAKRNVEAKLKEKNHG
jgi:hypothetical protein